MKSLLIALLLIFAGCNEKSSSPERVAPPICGESKSLKCVPPIADWNIEVHLASFPDNVLLKIEGIEILNECSGQNSPFSIIRNNPVVLDGQDFIKPYKKTRLEIFDLGSDCLGMSSYYSNLEQDFELEENESSADLVKIVVQ